MFLDEKSFHYEPYYEVGLSLPFLIYRTTPVSPNLIISALLSNLYSFYLSLLQFTYFYLMKVIILLAVDTVKLSLCATCSLWKIDKIYKVKWEGYQNENEVLYEDP